MEISNLNLALKESEYLLSLLMTSFMSFSKEKQEIQKNLAGEYCPCVKEKYLPSLTRSLTFSNSSCYFLVFVIKCSDKSNLKQTGLILAQVSGSCGGGVTMAGALVRRDQHAEGCCSVSVLQHLSQGAAAPSPPAG